MNKITLIIFALLATITMYSQDISGQWNGVLNVQGTQLTLVFNIAKTDNGYTTTMDSPDQGAMGIPVNSTSFENSILKLEIAAAGIQYEATLSSNHIFKGTFQQGGQSFPLNLLQGELQKQKINRPQEPKKPYPYHSEEVKFENTEAEAILAGTLTFPKKEGVFPVVILISGSGPQNRDEELMGHKPFLVLADHLTKNGIAVLRYDDRGTAQSTGNFDIATTVDFSKDVEAAINYLKTRPEINKNQIGLIGHSEGGIIAPMVAVKSKDVQFIVLLAGTGIPGHQLLLQQQELIGRSSGFSNANLQKDKKISQGAFNIVLNTNNIEVLKSKLTTYLKQTLLDDPNPEIPSGMSENQFVELQVNQLANPWMSYFIKYDPSLILEKIDCPVLALNGEKDIQVPAKVNLEAIKKALKKGGNTKFITKELQGLNHLFQECETGSISEYATIEQTFSPIALNEISNWIKEQIK